MQPVITLFKLEFLEYDELFRQLNIHPGDMKECEHYYTYSPPRSRLTKILRALRQNSVTHGLHFEKHPENNPQENHLESVSI